MLRALPLIVCALAVTRAQSQPAMQTLAMNQYASTTPYVDLPIDQLSHSVPELAGIKPGPSPLDLDTILQKTSDAITAQLPRIPNLLCREDVIDESKPAATVATSVSGLSTVGVPRSNGTANMSSAAVSPSGYTLGDAHHFEYMIHANKNDDGSITLEETRKQDDSGKHAALPKGPQGTGFASLWLIFAHVNRDESSFHYLGTQKVDGRATLVVAFAQSPDKVAKPSILNTGSETIPMIYQGFAWIDAQDFHILRLRTDLRAPLPQLNLKRITSVVDFSRVTIPQFPDPLWLPRQVEVLWQTNTLDAGEIHRYSKYHLFAATSRIIP